jgi:hypothetical protein
VRVGADFVAQGTAKIPFDGNLGPHPPDKAIGSYHGKWFAFSALTVPLQDDVLTESVLR